jgi:hypothetical protein
VTNSLHVSVVKQGPSKRDPKYENPKDAFNRTFTLGKTKRRLKNFDEVNCTWLVYSAIKNAVFCFCCKLFSSLDDAVTNSGYNNWRNLYHTLKDHEISEHHLEAQEN